MDDTLTTKYPQESVPFKYNYRSIMMDNGYKDPKSLGISSSMAGKDIYGNDKDPLLHWPSYKEQDNIDLYLICKVGYAFFCAINLNGKAHVLDIKDPINYFKIKLIKLSKISTFKKKRHEFSILLTKSIITTDITGGLSAMLVDSPDLEI